MKTIQLIFLLFLFSVQSASQERLGITNSNYYSTASIQLNPSSSVDSRTYMQLHLIGFNFYAKTNFAYLPNFNIKQIFNVPEPMRSEGNGKKFLYVNGSVEALSFVLSKRTYGVGFFLRARTVMDMRRVSYELASTLLNGDGISSFGSRNLLGQDFKNAKFSQMTWAEYGINFGKMISRQRDVLITVGGNIKYLTGINLFYANIAEFSSYNDGNGTFGVSSLDAKILRTRSRWGAGKGIGTDFGITYKIMEDYVEKYYANSKLSNCKYVDYKCKISLSVRDVGFIKFKGETTDTRVVGSGHYDPFRADTAFLQAIQSNFSNTTIEGKPIMASLPSALTGQIDYNFDNSIYLNVALVKNLIPTRITGVQSPDLLSIAPRVEFKQFEFALPLTLQKFRFPQLGFGLRYRSFVVGMDNLFPLFLKRDTYGINLYASLAVSIFTNSACNTKRMSASDCPSFRKQRKNRPKKRKHF
jgi:hypothetical protein